MNKFIKKYPLESLCGIIPLIIDPLALTQYKEFAAITIMLMSLIGICMFCFCNPGRIVLSDKHTISPKIAGFVIVLVHLVCRVSIKAYLGFFDYILWVALVGLIVILIVSPRVLLDRLE